MTRLSDVCVLTPDVSEGDFAARSKHTHTHTHLLPAFAHCAELEQCTTLVVLVNLGVLVHLSASKTA